MYWAVLSHFTISMCDLISTMMSGFILSICGHRHVMQRTDTHMSSNTCIPPAATFLFVTASFSFLFHNMPTPSSIQLTSTSPYSFSYTRPHYVYTSIILSRSMSSTHSRPLPQHFPLLVQPIRRLRLSYSPYWPVTKWGPLDAGLVKVCGMAYTTR